MRGKKSVFGMRQYAPWLLLGALFVSAPALAGSPVWQISKGNRTVYIGGTVHRLRKADYPLPAAFDAAYRRAAVIYFEADVSTASSPAFQQMSLRRGMFQGDKQLPDVLKPKTLARLKRYLKAQGLPDAPFLAFKPGFLGVALTGAALAKLGYDADGVDVHFDARAKKDHKARRYLETLESQIAFLAEMGMDAPDRYIRYTLDELENAGETLRRMTTAWRSGEYTELESAHLAPMRTAFPSVYQVLVKSRNDAWLERIEQMFETAETELVLVGALHLAGKDGLLARLKQKGYAVRELDTGAAGDSVVEGGSRGAARIGPVDHGRDQRAEAGGPLH